jgi:hypothetical protein
MLLLQCCRVCFQLKQAFIESHVHLLAQAAYNRQIYVLNWHFPRVKLLDTATLQHEEIFVCQNHNMKLLVKLQLLCHRPACCCFSAAASASSCGSFSFSPSCTCLPRLLLDSAVSSVTGAAAAMRMPDACSPVLETSLMVSRPA